MERTVRNTPPRETDGPAGRIAQYTNIPLPVTTTAGKRILLVEDDDDIADLLDLHLSDEGHQVEVVDDGDEGLERALSEAHDLIILDIMLPGTDGFDICRRLRQEKCPTPILMVTAKTEEVDKVLDILQSAVEDVEREINQMTPADGE